MSKSARVTLVAISERHAQTLFDWRQSPEIAQFMYTREPLVWDSHLAWIRSLGSNTSRSDFVIRLDEHPVGTVNLTEIDHVHRRCVFGMYVAEPSARIQGVGAAAECLILDHAFDAERMHKVSCEVFASNPAPIAMHKRMGFELEGTLRDHVFDGNLESNSEIWIDVIRLSLLASDWEQKRSRMHGLLSRLLSRKPTLPKPND